MLTKITYTTRYETLRAVTFFYNNGYAVTSKTKQSYFLTKYQKNGFFSKILIRRI